jgi:hypothetical protein
VACSSGVPYGRLRGVLCFSREAAYGDGRG